MLFAPPRRSLPPPPDDGEPYSPLEAILAYHKEQKTTYAFPCGWVLAHDAPLPDREELGAMARQAGFCLTDMTTRPRPDRQWVDLSLNLLPVAA